ncbi:MAG: thiamine phosphate synthase [Chitinophagales bacterium]|nr:thiamine phosphate synthase [Chitinophagales bacterium]
MLISRLHIITQDLENFSHIDQIRVACESGADWIQLRIKDTVYDKWKQIAEASKNICKEYGAKLIVNDSVQFAINIKADGVQLGYDDMPVHSARMLLGDEAIIGGSANTLEEAIKIYNEGANYIIVGPYKFTPNKKEMHHLLGVEGYDEMIDNLHNRGIDIPIIAIGGIRRNDLSSLLTTKIHGVAVSSAIFSDKHPSEAVKYFIHEIEESKTQPHLERIS